MTRSLEAKIPWLQRDCFALKNIDFMVEQGFITAVFGVNGAGKTTLLSALTGLLPLPDEASVTIAGHSLQRVESLAKEAIGFVFDDSPFDEGMSSYTIGDMYGKYYKEFDKRTYLAYLDRFEIPWKKPLRKLSKGMQMKFELAFALSHNAKLLVLDEPTASLDPVFRDEFSDILGELLQTEQCGVLISSQLVSELSVQADYTLLLSKGEQVLFDRTDSILDRYLLVKGNKELFPYMKSRLLGTRITSFSAEGLILNDGEPMRLNLTCERPTMEDVLYYIKSGAISPTGRAV